MAGGQPSRELGSNNGIMDLQLTKEVAFVAGSSRGIGRSIATALLSEGACVVITGRDRTALDAAYAELTKGFPEDRILVVQGDFSQEETIANGFRATVDRFGRID